MTFDPSAKDENYVGVVHSEYAGEDLLQFVREQPGHCMKFVVTCRCGKRQRFSFVRERVKCPYCEHKIDTLYRQVIVRQPKRAT